MLRRIDARATNQKFLPFGSCNWDFAGEGRGGRGSPSIGSKGRQEPCYRTQNPCPDSAPFRAGGSRS